MISTDFAEFIKHSESNAVFLHEIVEIVSWSIYLHHKFQRPGGF